ncbi:MAG: HAD family phosphatase [Pyrinomonadaceae bacterium]|nr:HAD family phosphatase [Pyrinomonadaceae bacterium]MCX7639768.1 HAD family phosphatase [Pyrinomonadaceae bacterium]MDW8304351.1 HAD family phosphatase [Acidobacteriota bacterium]
MKKKAAFYDLEGTLIRSNLVHTLAFYSLRQQGLWKTVKKTSETVLKLPLFGLTDLYSRNVFNEFFFRSYKGESADRLRYFADELFEKVLKPAIYEGARDLIQKSKKAGFRQIVLTGALDFTIEKLMKYLEIDEYAANRLEFVNGYATGRVLPPVMASATKARWIREYAEREGIVLSESFAYSDSISDLPMLSIVGHPVAVNPDFRLRQVALQHNWAILELD